jgi:hypothetical protein
MRFIFALYILCLPLLAHAATARLQTQEIERLKAVKAILREVDPKPLALTIKELENTGNPRLHLILREAMAHTYADIVRAQNVEGKGKKEWLYSTITLNMAYLQFGGTKTRDPLNALIVRTLREHLPEGVFTEPGFHQGVD